MDSILSNIDALFTIKDLFNYYFIKKKINKCFIIKPLMESLKGFGGLKKLTIDIYLTTNLTHAKIDTIEIKGTDEDKVYLKACKELTTKLISLMLVYGTE